jgi:hypothetical protein
VLVNVFGPLRSAVVGPDAEIVARALADGGLPSSVGTDAAAPEVLVSLGAVDGSSVGEARAAIDQLTSRPIRAVVFTPWRGDVRSTEWWDDLFRDFGFEPLDLLRGPLWDDTSWESRGLTGLALYARTSSPPVVRDGAAVPIPRSAVHPGLLASAQRVNVTAHRLVERLGTFDPLVDDPVAVLGRELDARARDLQQAREDVDAVSARSEEAIERALAETRAMDAARLWEADGRARAEEALARSGDESVLLRRDLDALTRFRSSDDRRQSVGSEFGRRAAGALGRRLRRRGLQAGERLSSLPGRAGLYAARSVAIYRSMTVDWLEETRALFDTDHYLRQRPGLAGSGVDPVVHYATVGWREGLDPHPLFATDWYVRTNAVPLDTSPLEHYVSHGWREGCDPHPLFDTDFYLRHNIEVAVADQCPLVHYLRYGWRERRDPHPLFDTDRYLIDHPELEASGECPLVHYVIVGWQLGHRPGALFDPEWYVENHPEAGASELPPYRYFLEIGVRRGDHPSAWAEALARPASGSDANELVCAEGSSSVQLPDQWCTATAFGNDSERRSGSEKWYG